MLNINTPSHVERYSHRLTCKKSIGTFNAGQKYTAEIMKCHKQDRYMVFTWNEYCIGSKPVLDEHFDEELN